RISFLYCLPERSAPALRRDAVRAARPCNRSGARAQSRRDTALLLDPGACRGCAWRTAGYEYLGHCAVLAAVRRPEPVRRALPRLAAALGRRRAHAHSGRRAVLAIFHRLRRSAARHRRRHRPNAAWVVAGPFW